jgi:hypothetical protein
MIRTILLIACSVCAVILIGCTKTENTNNTNTTNTTTAGKPAGSAPASSSTSSTASSGDKIGIAECDEYIAKYESCTAKVPEAGRAAYKSALEQTRASWKKLADNPQTRASLAAACKQATETQAAAWKMYGCAN